MDTTNFNLATKRDIVINNVYWAISYIQIIFSRGRISGILWLNKYPDITVHFGCSLAYESHGFI